MANFTTAISEAKRALSATVNAGAGDAALVGRIEDLDLSAPAAQVDECVSRFAQLEVEGRVAVGRYPPGPQLFPALGQLAAKRLRKFDAERVSSVEEVVSAGVALGYVFIASIEEPESSTGNRSPGATWDIWAPNINTGLIDQTNYPEDLTWIHRSIRSRR